MRRRVADAELAAEHAEQLKLASLHTPPADRDRPPEKRLRAAVGNLGVYAVCLGVVPDDKDRKAVAALMRATFPAFAPPEVAEAVGPGGPNDLFGQVMHKSYDARLMDRLIWRDSTPMSESEFCSSPPTNSEVSDYEHRGPHRSAQEQARHS